MTRLILSVAVLLWLPAASQAQWDRPPEMGGRTYSLGQPQRLHWRGGLAAGPVLDRPNNEITVRAQVGFTRDLMNPVAGLASLSVEAYLGARATKPDGGARVFFPIPYFALGLGADYNAHDNVLAPMVTAFSPVRRGGVGVAGGLMRIDWYPTRKSSFTIGLSAPVHDPLAGRGRPLRDHVVVAADFQPRLRYGIHDAQLEAVLDSLRVSADWVRRLVVPFLDQDGRTSAISLGRTQQYLQQMQEHLAARSAEQEMSYFHAQLERAFVMASGSDEAGRRIAQTARATLLDQVIIPYDRLLGRKKRNDTLKDLNTAARGQFSRRLVAAREVSPDRLEPVLFVFQQLTDILNDLRRTAADEWNDARLVWLPLQYGLLPQEYDEKAELDALLERVTDMQFRSSRVHYVANLQFHAELLRSIEQTRNYHVLWIHDFPANGATGDYDWASVQVAERYLSTLAKHIEDYDSAGALPTFFIFIDQVYYEQRKSRWLMEVLEDPLGRSFVARRGVAGDTHALIEAQQRLRAAVAASRVLNAEARQYGDAWLHNRVKVHVNVTNRADPSFWSGSLVATVFGYPDNVMRDHRKIAFRDVSEADPAAGFAILTGMGVGQQYIGPSWEDRAVMLEGPLLVELKRAARELLLSQGMREYQLPNSLRALPAAAAPQLRTGIETPAMLLVNGTGYLSKPLNVGKAFLYSMLPPGSVMKIPDSLWNSTFYGSLLVGACLRGADVSLIAPALSNAPSAGFPQMLRAHELLSRLLLARAVLGQGLRRAGGDLRIGLYALPVDTDGFASRAAHWAQQLDADSALRSAMPFGPEVLPVIARAGTSPFPLKASGTASEEPPKLHMKVQFFATRELWDSIAHRPEWPAFVAMYLKYRAATYGAGDSAAGANALPDELARIAHAVFDPASRAAGAAGYAIVGSQNQDYRGMFMDGEIGLLISGCQSLVPLLDLAFVEGTTTWIMDQAGLDRLLPPGGEMKRRFARIAKDAL